MKIMTAYSVKIKEKNHIFKQTVQLYREAVDYLIPVCFEKWDVLSQIKESKKRMSYIEKCIHRTKKNPAVQYAFDQKFYKFPTYLRRSAIYQAIGKVSSYKSNMANWENTPSTERGRKPSFPKAGYCFPCLYRDNMYIQTDVYEAKIKVFTHNTWDWITVSLRKSDVDYIHRHCADRRMCAPTLQKRGKQWFLDFPFEETVTLNDTELSRRIIVAVDLGINSSAAASVMKADGTILGRHFCRNTREYDSLTHALNRVKKAQQHYNYNTPRLWAKVKGINRHIAENTAAFILNVAATYHADMIVFEYLDLKGKIHGSKKQRLHHWKAKAVQAMVTDKAHRFGIRISRVCAKYTSQLAFDGSGEVVRGKDAGFKTDSMCIFKSRKVYNCDLSASYNIGARYFIREILKSFPERERLALVAKVPQAAKRTTCTLSTLISLNAGLAALPASA